MSSNKLRIILLSSVHSTNDHRIYYKEARSLIKKYPVLIVAPLKNNGVLTNIEYKRIAYISNRLFRIVYNIILIKTISALKPYVIHLHDPELLPLGLVCKYIFKTKIIYDVHENQHLDILQKEWLPLSLRKIILWIYKKIEGFVLNRADGIVLAEDSYREIYKKYKNVEIVRNYPTLERERYEPPVKAVSQDQIHLGYVGSVQRIRGILEMLKVVASIKHTFKKNVILDIVGPFETEQLLREARTHARDLHIADAVNFHGGMTHGKALERLQDLDLGLILYHPLPTHERILPVKLYEYMMMKKPVIATDIALWHTVIQKHNCGIFVDPFDEYAAAKAIVTLCENPETIKQMGENGFNAIVQEYNWETQERNLFALYEKVLRETT
jgi:glycosyltransferase involved in cell wall biosynthesis